MPEVSSPPGAMLMHDAKCLRDALGLSNRDARSEAELLLMRALDITRAKLIAYPEFAAHAQTNETYRQWLRRRLAGEPIAYVLGEREFYGVTFKVSDAVLIPRHETELLVELALSRTGVDDAASVLDLGTGSGVIGIAIALERPKVRVTAVDVSMAALKVARKNSERLLGVDQQLHLRHGAWFAPLAGNRFDLIVSNPPYVAEGDDHLAMGDVRFEPRQALLGGIDGLDDLRQIIGTAPLHLNEGGWLLCEHGYDQADACRDMLREAGFSELIAERDLGGVLRVAGGRWQGSIGC